MACFWGFVGAVAGDAKNMDDIAFDANGVPLSWLALLPDGMVPTEEHTPEPLDLYSVCLCAGAARAPLTLALPPFPWPCPRTLPLSSFSHRSQLRRPQQHLRRRVRGLSRHHR